MFSSLLESNALLVDSNLWATLLLKTSVKGLVLLLVSGVFLSVFRPLSASLRHLVRALTLFALIALPILDLFLPTWQVPILSGSPVPEFRGPDLHSRPKPVAEPAETAGAGMEPAVLPGQAVVASPGHSNSIPVGSRSDVAPASGGAAEVRPAPSPLTLTAIGDTVSTSIHWPLILFLVWLAGALIYLIRLALGLLAVKLAVTRSTLVEKVTWRRLAAEAASHLGISGNIRLLVNPRIEVAISAGHWRPAIILPRVAETWSLPRLHSILLHELCHVRRWDNLTNLVAQVACAFHWFNPLAWWTFRNLIIDRERACDDRVLACGTKASDYAGHLLEIARAISSRRLWGALEVSQSSALKSRLMAVLDPHLDRRAPGLSGWAVGVVVSVTLLLPVSAFQPWLDNGANSPANRDVAADWGQSDLRRHLQPQSVSPDLQLRSRPYVAQPLDSHGARRGGRQSDFVSLSAGAATWLFGKADSQDLARGITQLVRTRGGAGNQGFSERSLPSQPGPPANRSRSSEIPGPADRGLQKAVLRKSVPLLGAGDPSPGNSDLPKTGSDLGETRFRAEVVRIDLGSLGGFASRANDINDLGQVVGESRTPSGVVNPFLWTAQKGMVDLGNPLGVHTRSVKINPQGQILCETFDSFQFRGFVWNENDGLIDIGSLNPGFPLTLPNDMNGKGTVVGGSRDESRSLRAFVWNRDEGMIDLGVPGWSEALAVNDRGQVVGYGSDQAFLWSQDDGLRMIGPPGASLSVATAINRHGQVVGYAEFEDGLTRAFRWTPEAGSQDLGNLGPDLPLSMALAINDAGHVIGQSLSLPSKTQPLTVRAFRWTPDSGMHDIGPSLRTEMAGRVPQSQLAINALGQIVGTYSDDFLFGESFLAVLWTEGGQVELLEADDARPVSREAVAVNNRNQIVGSVLGPDQHHHASLWEIRVKKVQDNAENPGEDSPR